MGICKDCKYYTKENMVIGKKFGSCSCKKFVYIGNSHDPLQDDMLLYEDCEMYNAFLHVGENFGCVHFEERENG